MSDYSLLSADPEPRTHGRIVPSTPLPVLTEERDHRGREDAGSMQWEDPTNHWAALEASLDNKGSSDLRLMVEQLRRTTSEDERVSGNSRYEVKPTLPKFNAKLDSDGFVMYDCWKNRVLELLGMGYSPAVVKLQMFQSLSGLPSKIISNLQAGANVFDMISALDDAFLNLTSLESIKREFYQSRMRQGESVTDFWMHLGSCLGQWSRHYPQEYASIDPEKEHRVMFWEGLLTEVRNPLGYLYDDPSISCQTLFRKAREQQELMQAERKRREAYCQNITQPAGKSQYPARHFDAKPPAQKLMTKRSAPKESADPEASEDESSDPPPTLQEEQEGEDEEAQPEEDQSEPRTNAMRPGPDRCWQCGKQGHHSQHCPTPLKDCQPCWPDWDKAKTAGQSSNSKEGEGKKRDLPPQK